MLANKLKTISVLIYFTLPQLLVFNGITSAQNLEKIGKPDMVKVNGGLNFNSVFLKTDTPNSTRAPISWYLNGNINVSVLDWSLPFTYSYSNQNGTYTQPFNQYGVTPTYKWLKVHAGWCNMNFSQFTFSGYPFMGGGVEINPKNWKIALMYGRLKKAIEYDAINETDRDMSFKRMAIGAKAGYEKNGYGLHLIWFQAKDDLKSIQYIPVTTQIQPQENTVVSVIGKAPITKFFNLDAEYALSGFTRNSFAEKVSQSTNNKLPYIFHARTTSQFFIAFKSSLNFNSKFFSCGLNYERIDPDYKTLGIYYGNNDLENITLSPQLRLMKNKLNISLNTGIQHNNLSNEKLSTMNRIIGSGNIAYQANEYWNASASYSNFTSYSRNRPSNDPFYQPSPADTMKFYQVSQSANAMLNHTFGKTKVKQNITLMSAYQVSRQQIGNKQLEPSTTLNGNLAYGFQFVPNKTNLTISVNANKTEAFDNEIIFFGPGLMIGKSFLTNALTISFASIYNLSYTNNKNTGSVINERLNLGYSPKVKNKKYGKPILSMSVNYVTKFKSATTTSVNELTGSINLGYSF